MGTLDVTSTLVALIRGLEESIVLINNKGEILHATKNAEDLIRSKPLEGRKIYDFLSGPTDRVEKWLSSLTGSHFKDVKINILREGRSFPARLRMAAWPSSENEFIIMVSIVDSTYIEERKRDLLRKALTIEYLSRSRKIREGKLHESIYEILSLSSRSVNVERVNAWLYGENGKILECFGNFDAKTNELVPQEDLPRIEMPKYFKAFENQKMIVSSDSRNEEFTSELLDSYLIPNDIYSMMDVPVRSEGEIIGVICFEQVGHKREWSIQDQKFGLIAAQMVSLAVETHRRIVTEQELELALKQQQLLMKESNHRIKNNLTMIISMMRLQLDRCKDDYHRSLMQDSISRLYSIVNLHNLLTMSDNRVAFATYVDKLIAELSDSLFVPGKNIQLLAGIEPVNLSSSLAVSLGLIITEVATNAFKHAFSDTSLGCVRVELETKGNRGVLSISDTGTGSEKRSASTGMGMDIVAGIADHIGGKLKTSTKAGYTLEVEFQLK